MVVLVAVLDNDDGGSGVGGCGMVVVNVDDDGC